MGWRSDEREQKHIWVTAKLPVNLHACRLTLEARFGMSQTAVVDNHIYFGVKRRQVPGRTVGVVSAGYSTSRNDVDDGKWWMNSKWTDDKVDTMTLALVTLW